MYRPDFEGSFGLGALLGAIVPASIAAAAIGVAFYLLLCGLPMAAFLGRHIAHPAALGVAVLDALLAAAFAVSGSILDPSYESGFPWGAFLMVACFSLPAGYFYRRNVIAMREEAEFFS